MSIGDERFEEPPGLEWAEVDLRDHLPSVGFEQLSIWQRAVSQQAERLASSAGTALDVQADVYLFTQALRQVLRAADLVAEGLVGDPRRSAVEKAIARFMAEVPDAKNARDVLDHFDDYARGIGQLSHPTARNARDRKRAASAEAAREYRISIERDDMGACVLRLGAIALNASTAKDASERLAAAVFGVWWESAEDSDVADLVGDVGPDSPMFPVLVLLGILAGTAPEELLPQLVTPESRSRWDIAEVREATSGYGLASRVAFGAPDVAYVKLVKGGPDYTAVVREVTLVQAQILTIQRRDDLGGEWRIHQLGPAASPDELPGRLRRKLGSYARQVLSQIRRGEVSRVP